MYFLPGDADKPLVIFVTGGYNLARISYGTHNTEPSDYLAYWFNQQGFSFVGLSYPLDHKVFREVYPEFTIKDWASQIVEAAKLQIVAQKLPKSFVMLGWSMAGKSVTQVNKIAKANGLEMMYISLASDPSTRGLASEEHFKHLISEPTTKGLSSSSSLTTWFLDQIHEQNDINQHIIISDETYVQEIMGDQPVNLLATSIRHENKSFIKNVNLTLNDSLAHDYDNYPLMGLIHGDSFSDYINTLFTRFDWGPMLTRAIYSLLSKKMNMALLTKQEWNGLRNIIEHAPQFMSREITGNHLFFLGQKGAKLTVIAVLSLLNMQEQISNINSSTDLCLFTHKFTTQLQGQEPKVSLCDIPSKL